MISSKFVIFQNHLTPSNPFNRCSSRMSLERKDFFGQFGGFQKPDPQRVIGAGSKAGILNVSGKKIWRDGTGGTRNVIKTFPLTVPHQKKYQPGRVSSQIHDTLWLMRAGLAPMARIGFHTCQVFTSPPFPDNLSQVWTVDPPSCL